MKKFICLFLSIITVLSLVACTQNAATTPNDTAAPAENTDDLASKVGKVIIGTDGSYPPFNYMNENDELDGFEVAMVKEIAKRTGLEIEIQALPWDGIFGQMDSGKIDTVMCTIFPSAERQEKYDFSREYITDQNRIIVRKGDGDKYNSFEDLKGLKVGVTGGGNSYIRLSEVAEQYGFEPVAYSDDNELFDLSLGRVDAIYKSPVFAMQMAKENGIEIEVANCPVIEDGTCAIPWRKDDERAALIREAFTKATQEMIDDGTMKALCEEYLGMDVTAYNPTF